eukprot:SAG31_NODE_2787_length_5092_cov_2.933907_4_plen_100_part_00
MPGMDGAILGDLALCAPLIFVWSVGVQLQGLNATNAPTFLSETIHFDLEQLPAFHFKVQTAVHAERLQGTSEQKREQQENARPRPPKSKLPVPKPATFG